MIPIWSLFFKGVGPMSANLVNSRAPAHPPALCDRQQRKIGFSKIRSLTGFHY
jgi:hypothetical protein